MSRIHGTRAILAQSIDNDAIKDAGVGNSKLAQLVLANLVHVSAIEGVLDTAHGGTGADNTGNIINIEGNLTLSSAFTTTGAFTTSLTQSADVVLALPSVNGTLATEGYVDALAQALDLKGSVRAATQAALPAVTAAGSGVGKTLTASASGALILDGVTLVATDRVLVKDQVNQVDNGIYAVTAPGGPSTAFVLTRAEDCDGSPANEVTGGMYTFVEQGTASAGNGYVAIADGNIVVDTDVIVMSQFSGAGQITAGNGLEKTGNTIDIAADYWDDIQAINTLNIAAVTDLVQADLQKLADLDTVTAAELEELAGAGCVNADFVKLHNITSSAVQLSDVATLSKLASTANGDGASLIGVEAITNLTATTVQAALAELMVNSTSSTATTTAIQTELDDTQTGAGLNVDGTYAQNGGTHYISTSTSLNDADNDLDTALYAEEQARITADGVMQTEVDAIETGAGLETDGTYVANSGANYISTAGSLKLADNALDAAIKINDDEIDAIETAMGAMMDANGDFVTITGSNYMGSATDVEGALQALDTAVDAVANGAVAIVDYDNLGMGDGSQVLFTVSAAEFVAGSLKVFVNGLLMSKGNGAEQVQETTPGSGTFTFGTAPASTDEIIVSHR